LIIKDPLTLVWSHQTILVVDPWPVRVDVERSGLKMELCDDKLSSREFNEQFYVL